MWTGWSALGRQRLLFGYLLDDRPDAAAVRRFHTVGAHFDAVCIPTPDGLLIGRKREVSLSLTHELGM